jgi:hypothetical protein
MTKDRTVLLKVLIVLRGWNRLRIVSALAISLVTYQQGLAQYGMASLYAKIDIVLGNL